MLNVKIENKEYSFFSSVSVQLTYDKIASTFDLACLIDPDNKELLEIYEPLSYKKIEIFESDELIFTGVFLSHSISEGKDNNTLSITGYSTSGKLQDCEIPKEAYPLQSNGKTLRQITQKICDSLNVKLFVNQIANDGVNKIYEQAQAEPTQKASDYIARLAAQRDLILGNSKNGEVLLTKLRINEDYVGNYEEGQSGVESITLQSNGQQIHSRCTVLNQSNESDTDKQSFIATRELADFRPTVKTTKDGDNNDGLTAAKATLNAEAKAIIYTLTLKTHRYQNGNVIKPNRRLTLKAPGVLLFEKTEFFVEGVTLKEDKNGDTAVLKLLPLEALQQ